MGAAASARYRQRPASSKDGDASSKDAAAARCAEAERDEFVDADPSRVPGGPRARLRPSKLGDAPDDAHETDRVTAFSPSPDSSRSAQLHGAALITADKVNGWRPPLGVKPRGVGHLVFDSTVRCAHPPRRPASTARGARMCAHPRAPRSRPMHRSRALNC